MGTGGAGAVDTSHVIVLIPEKNDEVWQISSEKVPHMTLCFLGDQLKNVQQVTQFIRHLAETSLSTSTFGVDHRGILGDKSADVLFFHENVAKILEPTRTQLLSNVDIATAYGLAYQFPTWTPHLTLGYPDAPAKLNTEGIPFAVTFDRIALWTGDFEGVEFPLKPEKGTVAAMSDNGKAFLEHFGVKGMKWGVRRDNIGESAKAAGVKVHEFTKTSADAKKAGAVRTKAKIAGVQTLTNNDLQQLITRMNLERQFKDLKKIEHEESLIGAGKKWAGNFLNDVAKDTAASWLKRPGSNASGRTSARAYSWGQQVGGALDGAVVPKAIAA